MKTLISALLTFTFCFGINAQTHHIGGLFPTLDFKYAASEKLEIESFSFLSVFPVEKTIDNIIYPSHSGAFYTELDFTYSLNTKHSITGSYTYERANPFESSYRNENRIWLQLQRYDALSKFSVKNRIRYDARFIQNRTTDKVDFSPRLRYLLGTDFRLNDKTFYFSAYNEFFLDVFKERVSTYTENWAFAGVGFNVSANTKLETGPLVISWIRNPNKDWLNQYFLQFTLITKFPFKK